jgi:superfamily II DNA or RNA helicase
MKLRPYQQKAVEAVVEQWREAQSTLVVIPTGGGKTQVFSEVVRRTNAGGGRSIVLVHREELAFQAQARIQSVAGLSCEIEMAELKANHDAMLWDRSPCIVASVQSLTTRLDRYDPGEFSVLICDEAHHCTAPSWRRIIDYFRQNTELRVLGVTATPDRADEEALGQVFQTVAYDYEILNAIDDGWLVPVEQQMVHVGGLDFSEVRTTAGDLNGADLAAIMEAEENLQGVVGSGISIIGDRQTIMFAASVKQAEVACEIFNRHRAGMAAFICGATNKDVRRDVLSRFLDGTTQVLCNVGIATEGFDAPNASVVLNARPTKSRALYAQIAGRVLRPLSGLVDGLASPEERRAAIAASAKPSALLVDYVGNSGKHKLMSSADILGGNVSDEAIDLAVARARAKGGPVNMRDELDEAEVALREQREQARRLEQARKARLVARVNYKTQQVSPFDVFDVDVPKARGWDTGRTLTTKQRELLLRQGIDGDSLPYPQAKALLDELFRRWDRKLATWKQCKTLKRYGYDVKDMTMTEASSLLDRLAKNGWKPIQQAV